jgi:hypothetical protein
MLYLHLIVNLFLLLFWVRFWVKPENEFYFNPFLSGTTRFVDNILQFLRPVLMLPDQLAALALLSFFCVFKTIFFMRFGGGVTLSYGTIFSFTPDLQHASFAYQLLYGGLQFGLFIVRLWTLYFIVRILARPTRLTRAAEAFAFFARPFSLIPFLLQPFVLLALHFCITSLIISIGFIPTALSALMPIDQAPTPDIFLAGHPVAVLLKLGWLSLMSCGDGLMWMNNALLLSIVGSFLSMIFGLKTVILICAESVDVLLGRFSRRQAATSGIDFTPMIFFFIVNFIYGIIQTGLYKLITSPFVK